MKAPKAPDPVATAQAQSGYNRDAAAYSQLINMVDTNNPWGSTDYSQNGSARFQSSDGSWVDVPTFTSTMLMSCE